MPFDYIAKVKFYSVLYTPNHMFGHVLKSTIINPKVLALYTYLHENKVDLFCGQVPIFFCRTRGFMEVTEILYRMFMKMTF